MNIAKFINVLLFPSLVLSLLFSCKGDNNSVYLLEKAQTLIEKNPAQALILLDSISHPENMDRNNYMLYVVSRVKAKFKTNQDVTGDSLIFEAQQYFDQKNDAENAALAHFYTGVIYSKKNMVDKALECFLNSERYAKRVNNNLLISRSLHNIGNLYFDQLMMDSAIVRYKKALKYYPLEENTTLAQLKVIDLIGIAYEEIGKTDSAYLYFNKGLEIANNIDDSTFKVLFLHDIGVLSRDLKEYNKATSYLNKALAHTSISGDSLKIHLSLIKLYSFKNQDDSVQYYTDKIEHRLSEIEDDFILSSTYGILSEYYSKQGSYKESLHYKGLQMAVNEKIIEERSLEKIINVENKYKLHLLEQKQASERRRYLFIQIAVVLFIILITCLINTKRKYKYQKKVIENRRLKVENLLLKQQHESSMYLESIYKNFIIKWATIEDKVNSLLAQGDNVDKNTYLEIKSMVDDVAYQTNQQLIELAKNYLISHRDVGEKAALSLTEKELVLLILCYFEYAESAMAIILEIAPDKLELEERKLRIKTKLKNAGLTDPEINRILYPQ